VPTRGPASTTRPTSPPAGGGTTRAKAAGEAAPVAAARLCLAQDAAADALLAADPFALLVGMLLDQQIPMEKAFLGPWVIASRLGADRLAPAQLADADPEAFGAVMAGPPAVHRYHRNFAGRVQTLARHVEQTYGGDAAAIWRDVDDAAALLARLRALPGFGDQKARIFLALLGKQLGVRPAGWRRAAGDYGVAGSHRSVADVVDAASLGEVREFKRAAKAAAKAGG
jgi:uncharacterized HhH-GPD family protein